MPYFRHMDKAECTSLYGEPETNEHLNGKKDLFEWIKIQDGVTNAVLEGWIPETKQRPDIMFEYNNQKCVIEYQCSPIATEYLERHELYQAAGIKDIWIAGYKKYFKPNSRHKYLDDYVQGYYNPTTNLFHINKCSEQGKFFSKLDIKPNSFLLRCYIFQSFSIVHKTYKNKTFDELYELHTNRILEKNKNIQKKNMEIEKRISSISNYVSSFDGTFGKKHYYSNRDKSVYYLYGNSKADFDKIDINTNKKGFYKRIFDIKENMLAVRKLDKILCNFENDNWEFYSYISNNEIKVAVCLLNTFEESFVFNHHNIDFNDKDSIKKILLPHMKNCLEEGKNSNYSIRIMEVKN